MPSEQHLKVWGRDTGVYFFWCFGITQPFLSEMERSEFPGVPSNLLSGPLPKFVSAFFSDLTLISIWCRAGGSKMDSVEVMTVGIITIVPPPPIATVLLLTQTTNLSWVLNTHQRPCWTLTSSVLPHLTWQKPCGMHGIVILLLHVDPKEHRGWATCPRMHSLSQSSLSPARSNLIHHTPLFPLGRWGTEVS